MSTFGKNSRLYRTVALILLLIAMLGPWSYERVYMPPSTPCAAPNVQVAGDIYCGIPIPIWMEVLGQFRPAADLLTGEVTFSQWASLSILPLMLILPIVALGMMLFRQRDPHQIFYVLAWALAALAGAGFLQRGYYRPYAPPWGNVLFSAVALTALTLELLRLARTATATPPAPPPGHSPHPGESRQLSP